MQFLRMRAVCERAGLSRSTIYALIQRGEFPQPIRLSARASAWNADLVDAWQRERQAAGWTPLPRVKIKSVT